VPRALLPATALEEHHFYVTDARRLDAYSRALAEVTPRGGSVLDLGAGTGVLGILALRAGAGSVTAVEARAVLDTGRRIVEASGLGDRVRWVRGWSTEVRLPREFDVVVTDQVGNFGIGAGLFGAMADARERFLRPGGALVPSAVSLEVAPVEDAETWSRIAAWEARPHGIDLGPGREAAVNARYGVRLRAESLLGPGRALATADLAAGRVPFLEGEALCEVRRGGTLHGIGGWYRARLSPSVSVTNAPGEPAAITSRAQVLFPVDRATEVAPGDRVRVRMAISTVVEMTRWTVEVLPAGSDEPRCTFRQDELRGALVAPEDLRRNAPGFAPGLSERGRAALRVLALCGEGRTVAEIREAVAREFPGLFPRAEGREEFVQDLVERACRP
jgi:protein arginine N-methyltransferase 1